MNIQLLSGYNPYYNRQVKVHSDYSQWVVHEIVNVNFNPNDGVRAEHICNYDGDYGDVDYLLYVEDSGILPTIHSRWFILDAVRLRNGQCRFILKRDVMADYLYSFLNSKAIIHKGYINDYNDPSIYIKDGNYNRIKKAEHALSDITRIPWIVGYINKETPETTINSQFPYTPEEATYTVSNISNWEYYNKEYYEFVSGLTGAKVTTVEATYPDRSVSRQNVSIDTTVTLVQDNMTGGTAVSALPYPWNETLRVTWNTSSFQARERVVQGIFSNLANDSILQTYIKNIMDVEYMPDNFITNYDGKTIYDEASEIMYRIAVTKDESPDYKTVASNETITTYINSKLNRGAIIGGQGLVDTYTHTGEFNVYHVSLQQIFQTMKTTLSDGRNHLEDAPYDMFCIPYGKIGIRYGNIAEKFNSNKDVAIAMATAISEQLGANCFDIQLLPYFPCREILRGSDEDLRITRTKFNLITDAVGNPLSAIIWARTSEFTFNITNNLSNLPAQYDAIAKKVRHETLMYRICSPNYASAFEFSPAANNGVLEYQISCTYKPYNPYIHINPYFNKDGLYGGNYNDARGLICGGDFSLTQINDAWVNYELNNKNFQRVFDRQIESLELQNEIGRTQDIVGAIVGTAQGAATGAIMGMGLPFGGRGNVVAGAAGALASGIGGIADIALNEQLRQDQLNLTRFNFQAQIDNIKAIPDTLTKVTALNPQNKIFPFVEVYEATEEEKELCRDIIKWQGMSVEKIATISDYINYNDESFIKATLLRSDIRDNHIINAIADELSQGVYILNGGIL